MIETIEVRMHSKSGQGAKTVGQFIAEASLEQGKYVQAYAEFGAERIGAPMVAFARVSTKPIKTHAPIMKPDMIMVFDDTLMDIPATFAGLKENGIALVNTAKDKSHFKAATKAKMYFIDATKIAIETMKEARPNMPMFGAFAKITGLIDAAAAEKSMKEKWTRKLGPEKTEGNIKAFEAGFKAV